MSEESGNTPTPAPPGPGDTQPLRAIKKTPRWRSILLSLLGLIGLLVLGALGGYGSGIGERKAAQSSSISAQLMEQFQYALVDEQFGRYSVAKQRLEFIIQNGPSFPGAQNELAKVLVLMTIPTPTATLPPTPTPDLRGEQSQFASAQQLIAAGDWLNALNELDQLRKADPNFNTAQVDGMYYFGLRNYGVDLIQKQGNLEGGIYELTLAERFAPLDNTANQLREGARAYIQAASFFGVDWSRSVSLFAQVYAGWPAMSDGSMNAARRYQIALMRDGDKLFGQGNVCDASAEFQLAESIGQLDALASHNAGQAYDACNPPTEEPPTQSPVEPPTDTPAAP